MVLSLMQSLKQNSPIDLIEDGIDNAFKLSHPLNAFDSILVIDVGI